MRILLRDSRKRLYFRHGPVWTSNPDAAFDFEHWQDLFCFVSERRLAGMEAVLMLDNPRRMESVPLDARDAGRMKEAA